ncbi:MAG: hypothetical protein MZV70_09205 [Desulfobacterales bacterium]|nr:hypothetical protein [Desulfobacterales bacterium]
MKVITSHHNADFDSLSSMVAAKKLYPDAMLVFPGSQEKTLRDFLIHSTMYVYDIAKMKNIKYDDVDTLILVDTRQKSRIGELAKVVGNEKVKIHIYDHHPPSSDDIKGDLEFIQNYRCNCNDHHSHAQGKRHTYLSGRGHHNDAGSLRRNRELSVSFHHDRRF